jgi:ribosomal protein L37AE/L43A
VTDHAKVYKQGSDAPVLVIQTDLPGCSGKDFEHHERVGAFGTGAWRCPDCGDTGTGETALDKLMSFLPLLERLQEQLLDETVVFLLPSDATPGHIGNFFGRPVHRVRGIDRPLIALGARAVSGEALPLPPQVMP